MEKSEVKHLWNANCLSLEYFIKNYDFMYGHMHTYVCMYIEVRGQLDSIGSLFCRFQGLNSSF